MPAADSDLVAEPAKYTELPFPPIRKNQILHCSVHYWYPKYRALTPKARLIPLSDAFVTYLRADGIVLPPDGVDEEEVEFESDPEVNVVNRESESEEEVDSSDNETDEDALAPWSEIHESIKRTIEELDGRVAPKLNWSSPKDATWINPTNSMDCRSANDIYLMLKSSDFVTHDLEHWADGCVSDGESHDEAEDVKLKFTLMLRKHVLVNPSVEFRCFVRRKQLIGMCQRDLNHYAFLEDMASDLQSKIQSFFDGKLRNTFPDENFTFDIYIPAPHKRVWLIDINPWAPRTDPLLFSWLELLTMDIPELIGTASDMENGDPQEGPDVAIRLPIRNFPSADLERELDDTALHTDLADEEIFVPELRLIKKDDPEAYSFNTPQYSAHKLPRDVVEASQSGPGPLREFADQWKEALNHTTR